ncbi:MAG TPA: hypothetical protein VN207_12385 [Ktedonobacteraceae bacterium]|nr:hypothetical protein [Ktedonobacteraceae bacterium]
MEKDEHIVPAEPASVEPSIQASKEETAKKGKKKRKKQLNALDRFIWHDGDLIFLEEK